MGDQKPKKAPVRFQGFLRNKIRKTSGQNSEGNPTYNGKKPPKFKRKMNQKKSKNYHGNPPNLPKFQRLLGKPWGKTQKKFS